MIYDDSDDNYDDSDDNYDDSDDDYDDKDDDSTIFNIRKMFIRK